MMVLERREKEMAKSLMFREAMMNWATVQRLEKELEQAEKNLNQSVSMLSDEDFQEYGRVTA